ncbi:diguanylate cyclase domain-containing protein [Extibacter muris]|uniref:diguanylate cyclase domain-containing protein n=1 Tax=Extibacter muris TaxID=1796622 RepID=UPI001D07418F|nr:diguanylate cyclase [Extibacter muris]MCB6200468.1 diguanylate cyclase [Extibacter muris]MCQ4663421.1 diguanylate cyclase [Extibacter muris]MCQ4692845.1 diguanylate cyclase [Extibacter muris]
MDKQPTQHGQEYRTLLNSIPGGVQKCLNDETFTLVEVNRGFLDLFGYSRQEIKERFADRFIDMIHPADRAQVLAKAAEQFGNGEKATFQYRVLCRDGSCKWVLDNAQLIHDENGEERIFCVLTDVTESRNAREELRLSLELHQIIMDQATDIIVVWDFQNDAVSYSANWEKKFGYSPAFHRLSNMEVAYGLIHPDDVPALQNTLFDLRNGEAFSTIEVRVRNAEGRYIWCRYRATNQFNESGRPLKAVGVITDIDEEKRMIDDLRRRAERDALTGLYNREETVQQIRRHLEGHPNELCALIMIDTDNFKAVNDKQGHLFGDAVLSELAAGMKRLTRQSDVVGRIGGDEFTILLKNITSREKAAEKVAQLLDLFQNLFQQGKHPIEVTCSAGVAVFPEDGANFQALYHCADQALYQAKNLGKNRYVLYDKDHTLPVEQTGYSALGAAIDSDQQTGGLPGDLMSYVFNVLYDTSDLDHVIQLILEIVGKRFDVSRAYIFENSDDGLFCDNTYEWCNEGIVPQKESLQHFSYEQVKGYDSLFKDGSIFYCRDIYALPPDKAALFKSQGIHSTLQCAIMEEDRFRGFMGFDECTGTRMWTKEEIATLSFISQLLAVFLLKKRATDRDRELAVRLNTILDTQDAYIYAIEKGTYELLYLNHKTRELDSRVQPGMTCFRAFFGRSMPCLSCPLTSGAGEIYNPQYGVWTMAKAASMKWGDIDAHLLSCFDITQYKKLQK